MSDSPDNAEQPMPAPGRPLPKTERPATRKFVPGEQPGLALGALIPDETDETEESD